MKKILFVGVLWQWTDARTIPDEPSNIVRTGRIENLELFTRPTVPGITTSRLEQLGHVIPNPRSPLRHLRRMYRISAVVKCLIFGGDG